jgi:hypothetical protein
MTVIDGATNSTTTVNVGMDPRTVAVNLVTNKIYIVNLIGNNVTVIDGASPSKASTTTALTASAGPQTAEDKVTFTAHVAPAKGTTVPTGTAFFVEYTMPFWGTVVPTGTMFLPDGAVELAREPLDSSGHAAFPTSSLVAGEHTIFAIYASDKNYNSSSGQMTEQIKVVYGLGHR